MVPEAGPAGLVSATITGEVTCCASRDGAPLWTVRVGKPVERLLTAAGPRPSDRRIIALGGSAGARALEVRDGKQAWTLDAPGKLEPALPPLELDGDGFADLVLWGGGGLRAVSGRDGRALWFIATPVAGTRAALIEAPPGEEPRLAFRDGLGLAVVGARTGRACTRIWIGRAVGETDGTFEPMFGTLGDLDGNGYAELHTTTGGGKVNVVSGRDGHILHILGVNDELMSVDVSGLNGPAPRAAFAHGYFGHCRMLSSAPLPPERGVPPAPWRLLPPRH